MDRGFYADDGFVQLQDQLRYFTGDPLPVFGIVSHPFGSKVSQYQKVIAMGVAFKAEWPRWVLGPIGYTIIALTSTGYDE
ncbi:hypothetical protein BN1708_010349 [Verticillium longisporum]|uniref:Uncharacterized protein n=1 Tax=Verticillium longisporum TaxID=100787 RepID=A0A0G4KQZ2_VERLO|nr:hypothetical protein BN1708_010349 [Verticillium longisporum]